MKDSNINLFNYEMNQSDSRCIRIWTSRQYRNINGLLNKYDIETQYRYFPNLFFWMQEMCAFFINYGITKEDLLKKGIHFLYRGMNIHQKNKYKGFISTSYQKEIVNRFTHGSGKPTYYIFDVCDLPDFPVVFIDKITSPISNEKEVLLFPGFLTETGNINNDKWIKVIYQPQINIIRPYLEKSTPIIKPMVYHGGEFKTPIQGKQLVFYRKIIGRMIDVLVIHDIPRVITDFGEWSLDTIDVPLHHLDQATDMMPEMIDLNRKKDWNEDDSRKYLSYQVQIALYNPETKEIDALFFPEQQCYVEDVTKRLDPITKPELLDSIQLYLQDE